MKHYINVMLSESVYEMHILIILLIQNGVKKDIMCTVDSKALFFLGNEKSKYFILQCRINNTEICVLHKVIFKFTNSFIRGVLRSPKIMNNDIRIIKTFMHI